MSLKFNPITGQLDLVGDPSGGGGGTVDSVVAGANIDVDNTDPANPVISVENLVTADITDITATATELNYTGGVTSAIQTQLDGKAASLGSDDNYVTDAEKVKLSNLSGTNTGDQTLPVKATGAEVDTGTDDAKFVTPKAMEDSAYIKSTGNAATATTLATPRAIYGNNFDGSAALTQVIASTYGGTGNGFTKFSGPTTSEKTFTLPDASSTIVVQGGALGTPSSGVATNLTGTASGLTAGTVTTNANLTGVVTSTGNATAIADAALSIAKTSGLQTALDAKAPLASPTFTGTVVLPTVTLGGVSTLSENSSIALDPAGSADGKYSGITVTGTGGATIAFGDLVTLDKDDSRWELVDISVAAAATGDARGLIGIAVSSSTDGTAITVLLHGIIRADANFPALTIGAPVYASTTGDVVVTQPTTTDHVIRILGFGLTADEMYFSPDNSYITHT